MRDPPSRQQPLFTCMLLVRARLSSSSSTKQKQKRFKPQHGGRRTRQSQLRSKVPSTVGPHSKNSQLQNVCQHARHATLVTREHRLRRNSVVHSVQHTDNASSACQSGWAVQIITWQSHH